jgi:uncharacterized SAM-binding protein YcdF (DUF218 family)
MPDKNVLASARSRMTYVEPLILACLLILIAGLIRSRDRKLIIGGVLALTLISWPPIDLLLSWPLEAAYEIRRLPADVQAIVVLSSAVDAAKEHRGYAIPDKYTYTRCLHAAWLYRQRPSVLVLASGGSPGGGQPPISWAMRDLLVQAGVPHEQVLTEDQSTSTHENGAYSVKLLQQRGIRKIALVVEAVSMPRAAAVFRHEGIHVEPVPSSFREWGPTRDELIPSWKAIQRNEITLHEALGLVWYKLRGWI